MTVLGPVESSALGVTSMHEHILIDLRRVSGTPDAILESEELAVEELEAFRAAGGKTIVELTNNNLGRRPDELLRVAKATGLNVVMGCGWYRESYFDDRVFKTSTVALAEEMISEIEHGIGHNRIRPGIIGEIGSDEDYVSPAEERSFRAAARAHLATGLTISTHSSRGRVGLEQLAILDDEGVDLNRVIVGHCDYQIEDREYFHEILTSGAWIQFDTIREPSDWEIDRRVRMLLHVAEMSGLGRVLLAQDVCTKRHLKAYGGGGYDRMFTAFLPRLLAAGVLEDQISELLVTNPQAALTGVRECPQVVR